MLSNLYCANRAWQGLTPSIPREKRKRKEKYYLQSEREKGGNSRTWWVVENVAGQASLAGDLHLASLVAYLKHRSLQRFQRPTYRRVQCTLLWPVCFYFIFSLIVNRSWLLSCAEPGADRVNCGDVFLVASWATWATSLGSSHQPRHYRIHLHSKYCVACGFCACCAWVFCAGAMRASFNADRVRRPQLCVTDRWPRWPPVCALSKRSPGCQAVTSTYTREQFLSPTFFTNKKKKGHLSRSPFLFFFCHCAIQISLLPPTLAGRKWGNAESRKYSFSQI